MTAPPGSGGGTRRSAARDPSARGGELESELVAREEKLALLAHKMRNSLTSIRSSVQILLDYGTEDPSATAEFLTIIRDACENLARLIEQELQSQTTRGEASS